MWWQRVRHDWVTFTSTLKKKKKKKTIYCKIIGKFQYQKEAENHRKDRSQAVSRDSESPQYVSWQSSPGTGIGMNPIQHVHSLPCYILGRELWSCACHLDKRRIGVPWLIQILYHLSHQGSPNHPMYHPIVSLSDTEGKPSPGNQSPECSKKEELVLQCQLETQVPCQLYAILTFVNVTAEVSLISMQ